MPEVENRLIPVLRDGINLVKMVFFKELKAHLTQTYPERDPADIGKLSGAILNRVFGTPNTSEPFASFVVDNKALIDQEVGQVAASFEKLRIPLTDALRVQFLCDSQEGLQNEAALKSAQDMGILITDRAVPLPKNFMILVRRIGQAYGLIEPVDDVDGGGQPPGNHG
jgi:hypothetical protein